MKDKPKTPIKPQPAPNIEKPRGSSQPVEVPDIAPIVTNMDDHGPVREIIQNKD